MNAVKSTFTLLLCFLWSYLSAQDPGFYRETMDVNEVNTLIFNAPDYGWNLTDHQEYEVPAGTGRHSSFASSLWIGGLDLSGNLHFAGHNYRQMGYDFYAGPYRTTGVYDTVASYRPDFQVFSMTALSNGRVVFLGDSLMVEHDLIGGGIRTYVYAQKRFYPGLVELNNGNLLLYGDISFPDKLPLVEIDPVTFTGTITDSLDEWHGPGQVEVLNDGRVLFAGFFGCDFYDPATQSSTIAPPMHQGRMRGASLKLSDGRVLVSGGGTNLNISSGILSMEIFDPAQNNWTQVADMSAGRFDHSMLEMANGQVLIVGGTYYARVVDHYDPVTDSLTTPHVLEPFFKESTLLNRSDGRVLIALQDYQTPWTNLIIYDPVTGEEEIARTAATAGHGVTLPNGNLYIPFTDNVFREIDGETTVLAGQRWQHVWKVTRAEIDQFIQDFQNGSVDFDQYPVILDWPAHGSVADGEDYLLAPFVDVDQDSVYDPAGDGDYPCILGDQALWFVFNDDAGDHNETGGAKLEIQVKVMAYGFDCDTCNVPWLDHTLFFHYEVTNKGFTEYNDAYISYFEDSEIGAFFDDFIGTDTALGLAFVYNGDNDDEDYISYPVTAPSIATDHFGYGQDPPALGNLALNGPTGTEWTNVMTFADTFSIYGYPINAPDFYNLQQSIFPGGNHLTEGGEGNSGTVPIDYIYPGDPGFCGSLPEGWYNTPPAPPGKDRFLIQSMGPFNLQSGETVSFDYAKIWARSFNNANLASVCEVKLAATHIRPFFNNLDKSCLDLTVHRDNETLVSEVLALDLYPNPTAELATLSWESPANKEGIVTVYDRLGTVVLQKQIRSGQREVELQVNNLADGVYLVTMQAGKVTGTKKLTIRH